MISVLIPVYNYNIKPLVENLTFQLNKVNIRFEIVCIDDASKRYISENECIKSVSSVRLINLEKNIGRSKIRNLLAEKSTFDWLLFLDADVLPKSENFILNYINCIQSNRASVYCGGVVYEKTKPTPEKVLRWIYGRKREEIATSKRSINAYNNFFGANFLINKAVFESCSFNNSITKYGYEDVLFAEDLKTKKIGVAHIDNPVFHLGMEDNLVFLEKTKQALENLNTLCEQNLLKGDSIKILKTFQIVKAYKLNWLFRIFYIKFHKLFEYNLKSNKPNLFLFDFYKLTYFCFIN